MEILINKIILNDLEKATSINFLETPKSIEYCQGLYWFRSFISEPNRKALQVAVFNLRNVYDKYLIYNSSVHKEPIDVYKDLEKNWSDFVDDLTQDLICEPEDCPWTYQVLWVLTKLFEDLPSKLLDRASYHKFDKEFALTYTFGEDDNAEGEV